MKKPDLAKRLAEAAGVSRGEAADHLDRMVSEIIRNLRRGRPSDLPGVGRLSINQQGEVSFESGKKSKS